MNNYDIKKDLDNMKRAINVLDGIARALVGYEHPITSGHIFSALDDLNIAAHNIETAFKDNNQ